MGVRGHGWALAMVVVGGAGAACTVDPADAGPLPMLPATTSGATEDDGSSTGDDPTTGISGASTTGDDSSSSDGSSTGDDTTGTTRGIEGSTGDGSTGDGSTGDDTSGTSCPNEAACLTAQVIGAVSGDETSDPLVVTGDTPTWVAFQVTEDNESAAGEGLSFTATLDSPSAADYDLYVFRGAMDASTGCGGVPAQSTAAGSVDVVTMNWGEGGIANGSDDMRWIAVEIVPKADCPAGAQWTLSVDGDT